MRTLAARGGFGLAAALLVAACGQSAVEYLSSLARVAGPPPKNPSKILRGGSRRLWRFGSMECEFSDLRRFHDNRIAVQRRQLGHEDAEFAARARSTSAVRSSTSILTFVPTMFRI